MRAGQLRKTIAIYRNTPTISDGGSLVDNWALYAEVAAAVKYDRGNERFAVQQIVGRGVVTFRLRWSSDVRGVVSKDLIRFDGREYDIKDMREVGRREGIEIDAAARSEAPLISVPSLDFRFPQNSQYLGQVV